MLKKRLDVVKEEIDENDKLIDEEKVELITDVVLQRYEETKKNKFSLFFIKRLEVKYE